jgi:hypothetical protein
MFAPEMYPGIVYVEAFWNIDSEFRVHQDPAWVVCSDYREIGG